MTSASLVTVQAYAAQVTAPQLTTGKPSKPFPKAAAVLDQLHQAATRADWDTYFSLYLPEAVFIGTDATEHWSMSEFEGYARPTDGWEYTVKNRVFVSVKTQKNDRVLMFDELLDSASYGLSRGTGTLIKTDSGWKIAQYHLSFPIPNEIAKEITARIKSEK
ncbi:nuclear transport factor 2 family protein [Shewanella benthica]|nr:nuclear transport factor 2 family protein [Shewanella benthica]